MKATNIWGDVAFTQAISCISYHVPCLDLGVDMRNRPKVKTQHPGKSICFFLRAAEVSPIDTEGTCNLPRTWDFHGILCEMKPVQHLLHLFKALKIAFLRAACHQGASVTPSMAEMPWARPFLKGGSAHLGFCASAKRCQAGIFSTPKS